MMVTISSLKDWDQQLKTHSRIVAFFVYRNCGSCIQYEPVREHFVKFWNKHKQQDTPVQFVLFDVTQISKDLSLNTVTQKYNVQSLPTILYIDQSRPFSTTLQHRKFRDTETWIQQNHFPKKDLSEMIANCAVYELSKHTERKTIQEDTKEMEKKKALLTALTQNMENPFLDTNVLVSWIPLVFKYHPTILNDMIETWHKENPQDKAWYEELKRVQKQSNVPEVNHSLPANPKLRDFLYIEMFHFLIQNLTL